MNFLSFSVRLGKKGISYENFFDQNFSTFFRGRAFVNRMQGLGQEHQAQLHGQTGVRSLRADDRLNNNNNNNTNCNL